MPLRKAITEGVGQTGGVITSAGLILAGTFGVLTTLPIQLLVQFGLITAIGVLLDTFIVRRSEFHQLLCSLENGRSGQVNSIR